MRRGAASGTASKKARDRRPSRPQKPGLDILVSRQPARDGILAASLRDGRLVDEAVLSFALAGVEDLLEEIRAARSVRAQA
jgi:hypothetical protein